MERKFILALDKVLTEKIFKNERVLCSAAGVDQGGFNRFLKTSRFKLGKGERPEKPKDNLNLDAVSKLVDTMGGRLVFPWDNCDTDTSKEVIELKSKVEQLQKEVAKLKMDLYACEKMRDGYENIIRDKLPSYDMVAEGTPKNKSCA